jgi:hypothetical protein
MCAGENGKRDVVAPTSAMILLADEEHFQERSKLTSHIANSSHASAAKRLNTWAKVLDDVASSSL